MPIKLQEHNNGNSLQLAETVKNLIILGQNINSEYQQKPKYCNSWAYKMKNQVNKIVAYAMSEIS